MGLFDRFTKVTNKNVTLQNIDKVTDDKVLADIALNNSDFYIRNEAVSRIKDDNILASLVHSSGTSSLSRVGMYALECISDEKIIADLWCNSGIEFSNVSLNKVSNPELLARIAKEAPNNQNRRKALDLVPNSDEMLYDIYKRTGDTSAVYKIKDEDILKEIFNSAKDMDVCRDAISHIHDESFLREVFKTFDRNSVTDRCLNCKGDRVRIAIVNNISDESFLEDVANNYVDSYVREAAVKKVNDKSVLSSIEENDSDLHVRQAARKRLEQLE